MYYLDNLSWAGRQTLTDIAGIKRSKCPSSKWTSTCIYVTSSSLSPHHSHNRYHYYHYNHHHDHHHGGSGNVEYDHILCVIPPVLTAAGCVLLFLFSDQLYALLEPIMAANR